MNHKDTTPKNMTALIANLATLGTLVFERGTEGIAVTIFSRGYKYSQTIKEGDSVQFGCHDEALFRVLHHILTVITDTIPEHWTDMQRIAERPQRITKETETGIMLLIVSLVQDAQLKFTASPVPNDPTQYVEWFNENRNAHARLDYMPYLMSVDEELMWLLTGMNNEIIAFRQGKPALNI